jgi:NADH-quinone oxidoreductase subunit H
MRAAAQMISYEAVIGLSLVGAVLAFGTASMRGMVDAQAGTVLGLLPKWGIFLQPLGFLLFFAAALAETKRVPFDLPEGESEIIGYFIEYSGLKFAMFFLGEFIEIVLAAVLMTVVYFGGWHLPWLDPSSYFKVAPFIAFIAAAGAFAAGFIAWRGHDSGMIGVVLAGMGLPFLLVGAAALALDLPAWAVSAVTVLAQVIVFAAKAAVLVWLQFMIRWTLPRFRFDQLLTIGWKKLVPWSLANIAITGAVLVWAIR